MPRVNDRTLVVNGAHWSEPYQWVSCPGDSRNRVTGRLDAPEALEPTFQRSAGQAERAI